MTEEKSGIAILGVFVADLAFRAGRMPGIGETIDWARALVALRRSSLDYDAVNETLGCLLRSPADIRRFRREQFYERAWEQRLDVSA